MQTPEGGEKGGRGYGWFWRGGGARTKIRRKSTRGLKEKENKEMKRVGRGNDVGMGRRWRRGMERKRGKVKGGGMGRELLFCFQIV